MKLLAILGAVVASMGSPVWANASGGPFLKESYGESLSRDVAFQEFVFGESLDEVQEKLKTRGLHGNLEQVGGGYKRIAVDSIPISGMAATGSFLFTPISVKLSAIRFVFDDTRANPHPKVSQLITRYFRIKDALATKYGTPIICKEGTNPALKTDEAIFKSLNSDDATYASNWKGPDTILGLQVNLGVTLLYASESLLTLGEEEAKRAKAIQQDEF